MAIFSAINAGKARKAQGKAQDKLDNFKYQDKINPYDEVTDLSGMVSNPFANLQVATGAAEFQGEQADISLANTLDTLRATGAGAGGATAYGLRSARGLPASSWRRYAASNRPNWAAARTSAPRRKRWPHSASA